MQDARNEDQLILWAGMVLLDNGYYVLGSTGLIEDVEVFADVEDGADGDVLRRHQEDMPILVDAATAIQVAASVLVDHTVSTRPHQVLVLSGAASIRSWDGLDATPRAAEVLGPGTWAVAITDTPGPSRHVDDGENGENGEEDAEDAEEIVAQVISVAPLDNAATTWLEERGDPPTPPVTAETTDPRLDLDIDTKIGPGAYRIVVVPSADPDAGHSTAPIEVCRITTPVAGMLSVTPVPKSYGPNFTVGDWKLVGVADVPANAEVRLLTAADKPPRRVPDPLFDGPGRFGVMVMDPPDDPDEAADVAYVLGDIRIELFI
ncbi:MAG: hypothetical protein QM638_21825 [Nocardioides sp.]|uniref:hypothetical protein n=1 Tax=Nocardioides sp. TaxID=35761 RepID=UPI0039E4111E